MPEHELELASFPLQHTRLRILVHVEEADIWFMMPSQMFAPDDPAHL